MRIQKGWYWLIIMTIEEIMVYITHKEKAEEVYGGGGRPGRRGKLNGRTGQPLGKC